MTCSQVQRSISAYCDGRLPVRDRADVAAHLEDCRDCASISGQLLRVRGALRGLPAKTPPAELTTALRVLASRERARRASRTGADGVPGGWALRARLWAGDMMRPFALPMAGGLISALVLFTILAPSFARPVSSAQDVPTWFSTGAAFVSMGPYGLNDDDQIVVDVTVDSQGRMVEYTTPGGQRWVNNPQTRRVVENALLLSRFSPGTNVFGQPIAGKVRLTMLRSEIEVKG